MKPFLYHKLLWKCIFILYMIFLFLFVILKLYIPNGNIMFTRNLILQNRLEGIWNMNLIPFRSIHSYFNFNTGLNYLNILGNTVPFGLLGLLLSISQSCKYKITNLLLFCFLLILFFEIVQFVLCMGWFDVDDIILNEFSCFIGMILYALTKNTYSKM